MCVQGHSYLLQINWNIDPGINGRCKMFSQLIGNSDIFMTIVFSIVL